MVWYGMVGFSVPLDTLYRLFRIRSRRLRGDLIETCKILTNKEHVDASLFFQFADPGYNIRGHCIQLYKPDLRLSIRKHFCSQRVIDTWNDLPQNVVDAPSVNSFKNRLDK